MNELNCVTLDIKKLTEQIFRVRLKPLDDKPFEFEGGQYLYLLMPDGKRIPLSIASAPEEKQFIELHLRLIPGHELAAEMMSLFRNAKKVHIDGPYGKCVLKDRNNKVAIIAGGTGFSPMKSLLESAFNKNFSQEISLYLGAQSPVDLYQSELVNRWNTGSCQFRYIPVVNEPDENWSGATGFPHQVLLDDLGGKTEATDYYLSGSAAMVMNVYEELKKTGVNSDNIFSDILDIKRDMGEKV